MASPPRRNLRYIVDVLTTRSSLLVLGLSCCLAGCGGGSDDASDDGTTGTAGTDTEPGTTAPPADDDGSGDDAGTTTGQGTTMGPPADDTAGMDSSGGSDDTGAAVCDPPEALDVLFIGNSYTYTYDLPALVATLGDQIGIPLYTEGLTTGGQNLQFHLDNPATAEAIMGRDWDIVVLQGHSTDTVFNLENFLEAGQALSQMVVDAGATPVLYETWARKEGHELYDDPATGGTPEAMQQIIRDGYAQLSALTGAEVVPVGDAWEVAEAEHPEIDPFGPDFHHPSLAGAYLSANVFLAALTDVTPVGNVGDPPGGLDPTDATALQGVAESVVQPVCSEP